jgi:hypothetical protein
MATATLTFDLNDIDDRMEHLRCVNSSNMASAIWELVHNTRKSILNDIEFRIARGEDIDQYDAVSKVFNAIHAILSDNNVNIDEYVR